MSIARISQDRNEAPYAIGSESYIYLDAQVNSPIATEKTLDLLIFLDSQVNSPIATEKTLDLLILDTESLFTRIKKVQVECSNNKATAVYNYTCKYLKHLLETYVALLVDCEKKFDVNIYNITLDITRGMGLIIKTVLLYLLKKKLFLRSYYCIHSRVKPSIFQKINPLG